MRNVSDGGHPKTILHIIDALNYGGAQKLLVLLAKWTAKDSYKTIVCSFQPHNDLRQEIAASGARVICFNRPRPSSLRPHAFFAYIYRNLRDLLTLCAQEQVDVIQCHLSDAEFLGILAGRLAHTRRIITTVHYPDLLPARRSADIRNRLRILVTRILYGWADYVIAVSRDVAGQIKKIYRTGPGKIRIIVNRIDVESFAQARPPAGLRAELGLGQKERVLTVVGRLMPPKGHRYLIDAMAFVSARFADVKLLCVGDGDLRRSLMQRCEALELGGRIRFLGSRADIPEILALSHIFVLPSLWEGTSLALLEAMAAAKPIVATEIPGNRGLLEHGQNAYLVPPGRSRELYKGIAFLLEHPRIAQRYGKAAFQVARTRFDIRQTVSSLEALWNAA